MTDSRLPREAQERLAKVEALIRRPGTAGERAAAIEARERIFRTHGLEPGVPPREQPRAGRLDLDFGAIQRATDTLRRAAEAAARAAKAADEMRRQHEARMEAERRAAQEARQASRKLEADAAFLRRPSNQRVIAILQQHPLGAPAAFIAEALGWKVHTLRAAITRLRQAGAPIDLGPNGYRWRQR